jgi:hypothetical protein
MGEHEVAQSQIQDLSSKVEKLVEFHEMSPPTNTADLGLMAKVLNRFKVARMNEILKTYHVDRPAGVKKEGKAALIVKHVPNTQLFQLLEESGSLSKTEDASTPPCPKTVSKLAPKIAPFRQMTLEENLCRKRVCANMSTSNHGSSVFVADEGEEEPGVSTKRRTLGRRHL